MVYNARPTTLLCGPLPHWWIICIIKMIQYLRRLGVPLIAIFTHVALWTPPQEKRLDIPDPHIQMTSCDTSSHSCPHTKDNHVAALPGSTVSGESCNAHDGTDTAVGRRRARHPIHGWSDLPAPGPAGSHHLTQMAFRRGERPSTRGLQSRAELSCVTATFTQQIWTCLNQTSVHTVMWLCNYAVHHYGRSVVSKQIRHVGQWSALPAVPYPGILFGGGFNKFSWGQRERGSRSGSPP